MAEMNFQTRSKTKKTGAAILCGVLILTTGSGLAFASNGSTPDIAEHIKEDIVISDEFSFDYKFSPDPDVYEKYSKYGLLTSADGKTLSYQGQRVRLFVDEASKSEAFFLDEEGTVDLSVERNASGDMKNITAINEDKAREYRNMFFADDITSSSAKTNSTIEAEKTNAENTAPASANLKYQQYSAYNITYSTDGEILYFNGRRVKFLVDEHSDGSFKTYWYDESGTANLSVVKNSAGQITSIEQISYIQIPELIL